MLGYRCEILKSFRRACQSKKKNLKENFKEFLSNKGYIIKSKKEVAFL